MTNMSSFRWDPFRELVSLQERMSRILDDRLRPSREESLTGTVTPPVDIYETEQALVLEADIPGLEMENLDIRVENNTLTVRGERRPKADVKEDAYHRVERSYGTFTRSFSLPNTIDTEKISAAYNNGVLKVTMAKREETKPRQIRVQVQGVVEGVPGRKQVA